jgi:uroporphyrin-3 C-methyltransferase
MTEQQNQSAVVEETREAVETTPQPEKNVEKKNGGSKTSLALSAIAIAIALAAGVGLYGLTKTQATRQSEASAGLSSQIAALQKAQESQKASLKASSSSRPTS